MIYFFLVALLVLILSLGRWLLQRIPVYRWRRQLSLSSHNAQFSILYQGVNAFALSKEARINHDSLELIYGEITFESFIALLSLCHPNANTVFYDLGSGSGKAVIAAAMVFPLKRSCGVELLTPLHDCARQQQAKLAAIPAYQLAAESINFVQADLFTYPIQEANLVYVNATAFFSERWQRLSTHLETLSPGSIVLSTSKAVNSKKFLIKKKTIVKMSWGLVEVYIQLRNHD